MAITKYDFHQREDFLNELYSLDLFNLKLPIMGGFYHLYMKDLPCVRILVVNSMYEQSLRWETYLNHHWREQSMDVILHFLDEESRKKIIFNLDFFMKYMK